MPTPHAVSPTTTVTEIPGRYCPIYLVDKRTPGSIAASSTTTTGPVALLPRAETIDASFNTPVNLIDEIGANAHVGAYDDLPEAKLTISSYDAGFQALSLIAQTGTGIGSKTVAMVPDGVSNGFLSTTFTDVIRQFADPNGNVFASAYSGSMCVDEFGFSLKARSVAMESYTLTGFNTMKFRGAIQPKCYFQSGAPVAIATGADAGFFGFSVTALIGTDENVTALPEPTTSQPASYWVQNGCINFLKVERWRSSLGWITFPELANKPANDGAFPSGSCYYNTTTGNLLFKSTDMAASDVFFVTYCTYKTDLTVSTHAYNTIYATDPDTSDPVAIPTRLTPFTIYGNNIPRGQSLDVKVTLKRDRAEGIGDVTGIWGPPAAPEASVSLEVKKTDFGLNAILTTGSPAGTDTTGTVAGDFYDPDYAVRYQINNAMPIVANLYDPRDLSLIAKTYTLPAAVLNSESEGINAKNAVTVKYSGIDQNGNMTITYHAPA